MSEYDPESYWSRVGEEIRKRGQNYIAGDDNPYSRYKRRKFLRKFLNRIPFGSKIVLEVGFGPGGNLRHVAERHRPAKLLGADISQTMFELATENLRPFGMVELTKFNGTKLPYADSSMDISFTVTVLQHNTKEPMLRSLVQELCRVTKRTVVVMEDIGSAQALGCDGSWIARQVDVYKSLFRENSFQLARVDFLNTRISRHWQEWVFQNVYERFLGKRHTEGSRIGLFARFLIGALLPITSVLDEMYGEAEDLAKMVFERMEPV